MRPIDCPESWRPSPTSFWRPCCVVVEKQMPYTGLIVSAYRIIRLIWVMMTIPLWIVVVIMAHNPTMASLTPRTMKPSFRPSWTMKQKLLTPLIGRVIWSITYGIPPRWYQHLTPPYGGIYKLPIATVAYLKVPIGCREWYQGHAVDPNKLVHPLPVPAYWITPNSVKDKKQQNCSSEKDRGNNADVVLVLAGGGYVEGHPLEGRRCYDISKRTEKPVLGINYRKAVHDVDTFPAALQDAITAYAYLVHLGYKKIAVVGDSAGGGLTMTLSLYLTMISNSETAPKDLLPPSHIVLICPWVDLSLTGKSIDENSTYDIINPTMLATSVYAYTRNTNLPRSNPIFSPALKTAIPLISMLVKWANPHILLIYGTAELLLDEAEQLANNFKVAGLNEQLKVWKVKDEVHVFPLLPSWISSNAEEALDEIAHFLVKNVTKNV